MMDGHSSCSRVVGKGERVIKILAIFYFNMREDADGCRMIIHLEHVSIGDEHERASGRNYNKEWKL